MNPAYISAFAALAGTIIGGLTSRRRTVARRSFVLQATPGAGPPNLKREWPQLRRPRPRSAMAVNADPRRESVATNSRFGRLRGFPAPVYARFLARSCRSGKGRFPPSPAVRRTVTPDPNRAFKVGPMSGREV